MLRLLVADDNPITLDFLASALRQLGWHAVGVPDGPEAVAQAAADPFDILLLDARMPILGGAAALARIRAGLGETARAPALATTASTDRDTIAALLAAGFEAVLSKPISIADLRIALLHYDSKLGESSSQLFDETRAHDVVGGDPKVVNALRELLLAELERLPGELSLMACQGDAGQQLDDRLHRLAASAGFCAAVDLENAVAELQATQKLQAGWPQVGASRFSRQCEHFKRRLQESLSDQADRQ